MLFVFESSNIIWSPYLQHRKIKTCFSLTFLSLGVHIVIAVYRIQEEPLSMLQQARYFVLSPQLQTIRIAFCCTQRILYHQHVFKMRENSQKAQPSGGGTLRPRRQLARQSQTAWFPTSCCPRQPPREAPNGQTIL